MYIPPNVSSAYQEQILNFLPALSRYDNLILMGDFNLADVDWEGYSSSTAFSSSICELIFDLNLSQLISQPTHIEGNILDVVFTLFDICNTPEVIPQLPFNLNSDHFLITFTVLSNTIKSRSSTRGFTYDYSKADWDGISAFINDYDFDRFLHSIDIESLWAELKQVLYNAMESFTPKVFRRKHQRPKWFTPQIQHELNRVHTIRKS